MEIIKKDVGNRIRNLRKQHNLTMDELAKVSKVGGRSTVNGWEKGRSLPPKQSLIKIANYFKVSEYFLLYGSMEEFVLEILSKDIWKNEELYGDLTNIIWQYVLKSQPNISEMLSSIELGLISGLNKKPLTHKESEEAEKNIKADAINKAVLSVLDEILKQINKNNIGYDVNNIVKVSSEIFERKLKFVLNTFSGKVTYINEISNNILAHSNEIVSNYKNLDDFIRNNKNNEVPKRDTKQLINDYFESKLISLLNDFNGEVNELDFNYSKALKDHDVK